MDSYRHIIFDFDGTLADTGAAAIEEYERLRKEQFQTLPAMPPATFDEVFAGPLKSALCKWVSQDECSAFFDAHSARMRARAGEIKLFDGVEELLPKLPDGSCSIVTSSYSPAVEHAFDSVGLCNRPWLYRISGRELRQPKSLKISTILSELNLDSGDAIYVGDIESDIIYCRSVPIDIICVTYGYQTKEYLEQFDSKYMCHGISSLSNLLDAVLYSS